MDYTSFNLSVINTSIHFYKELMKMEKSVNEQNEHFFKFTQSIPNLQLSKMGAKPVSTFPPDQQEELKKTIERMGQYAKEISNKIQTTSASVIQKKAREFSIQNIKEFQKELCDLQATTLSNVNDGHQEKKKCPSDHVLYEKASMYSKELQEQKQRFTEIAALLATNYQDSYACKLSSQRSMDILSKISHVNKE